MSFHAAIDPETAAPLRCSDRPRAPLMWFAALAIVALQLVLIVTHDPWRDEYQSLQVALQTPTLSALFAQLRYEGHPPLWYLLLRAVGTILPVNAVLPVVQAAIAATTTTLILLRTRFVWWMRAGVALSPFFLFEYGVVARGLSLGVALLVLAFVARSKGVRWIAIALLPLVEFQFGLLSIVLLAIAWRDRWWSWTGAAAWLASGLAAAWSVRPAPDLVPAAFGEGVALEAARLLKTFAALLVPINTAAGRFEWGGTLPHPLWAIAGPGFLAFAWFQLRGRPFALVLFAGFVAATAAMTTMLYPLALRHVALVAVLLILLMARETAQGRAPDCAFRVWIGVLAAGGLLTVALAASRPFDRAGDVARFIRARALERAHWVAYPEPHGQAIAALLGIEALSLPKGCTQSFMAWNQTTEFASAAEFGAALSEAVSRFGTLYVVTDKDFSGLTSKGVVPIAAWDAGYDGTAYRLYRMTGPATGHAPQPCPPTRRPLRR